MMVLSDERVLLADLKFHLAGIAAELKFRMLMRALKANFNPAQPRDARGWWTVQNGRQLAQGESINDPRVISDATPDSWILGEDYAADGHHFVSRGVFTNEKYDFSPETMKVFETETTGRLKDPTSNRYDDMHRQYNKAVGKNSTNSLKEIMSRRER